MELFGKKDHLNLQQRGCYLKYKLSLNILLQNFSTELP